MLRGTYLRFIEEESTAKESRATIKPVPGLYRSGVAGGGMKNKDLQTKQRNRTATLVSLLAIAALCRLVLLPHF